MIYLIEQNRHQLNNEAKNKYLYEVSQLANYKYISL